VPGGTAKACHLHTMKSRNRTSDRKWPGPIRAVGRSRQAANGRETSRARAGEAEDGSLPTRALPLASSRQHQVMARRNTYHLSTRLRSSPSAMTQAGSGTVRSAAGRLIRSSNRRSDRHVACVSAEPMDVDLAYADRNPVSRSRRERQGWRSPCALRSTRPDPSRANTPASLTCRIAGVRHSDTYASFGILIRGPAHRCSALRFRQCCDRRAAVC
jgi:hypothetical protein